MQGKEIALGAAHAAVKAALELGAKQAEARFESTSDYLTRFANSVIHQNVGEHDASLVLRTVLGKRVSTVGSGDLSPEGINKLAQQGHNIARVLEEDPDFTSLPEPQPVKALQGLYFAETADCTPETRAEMVGTLISEAHALSPKVREVSGAFNLSSFELGIANSLGIEAYSKATLASFNTTVISRDAGVEGFGTAEDASRDIRDLKPALVGKEAGERAVGSLHARSIDVGEYPVIFEPYAVAGALGYLSSGFSAQSYQYGTSWMNDLIGQKVFSDEFTIWDDGRDQAGLPFPFDFEGIPKRKLVLIEGGVPKSIVYDSYTAHKDGEKSTGHAGERGGGAANGFLKLGNSTKEEMIADTKNGVLVTNFWYVRVVHAKRMVVTGMTRDGTWLIQDGEVKYPVRNFRFTDSLLKTFANIDLVGREGKRIPRGKYGGVLVPALKTKTFLFTGQTQY